MAQSNFSDVMSLVTSWASKTDAVLLEQLQAKGIGVTDELRQSVSEKVYQKAGDLIQYDLTFMSRGRFRDMGAGREVKVETMAGNRSIAKKRKPAKWFSRPFYGRLNALQGAIGFKIMEQSINSVIENITADGAKRG